MAKRGRAEEIVVDVEVAVRVPQTAGACQKYIQKKLTQEFPGIVSGFVEAAKSGSVPHVKLVNEILKDSRVKKVRPAAAALLRKMAE